MIMKASQWFRVPFYDKEEDVVYEEFPLSLTSLKSDVNTK